ncbi:MAG: head GIN domain-containing protein [Chryseotalea sp.]
MKGIILSALVFGCFIAFGQDTETRKVVSFRGIKAQEAIDVYLKKGTKEEIKIEASGVATSDVLTELSGDYLKIHMKDGRYRNKNVKVYVIYVELNKISVSSAASVYHQGVLYADKLEINASSAGDMELKIAVSTLQAEASSAAKIEVTGTAKKVYVEASSAGDISAFGLQTDIATADASSAGNIQVSVKDELNAEASSGGSILYRGNPDKSNTRASSGGSVRKSN